MDDGREAPNASTLRESKPGFTLQSAFRLRIISPAAINNTSAMAISATTKTPCARCFPPPDPRPPSFNVSCRFGLETRIAGTKPNRIAHSSAMPAVNNKTLQSIPTSLARGNPEGKCCSATFVPHAASNNPSPPPATASSVLSVRSWRMILPLPAPSAARTANSRLRPIERAKSRFATFTHAIESTKPTAASNTIRSRRTLPTICSFSGIRVAPIPLSASG